MKCDIQWNKLSPEGWESRFATIRRSNILQDYAYGLAHARLNHQQARWGLIFIDGQEAGLAQILEARILWGAIHGLILDRGPLWFDGFGGAAHIQAFFQELNRQFPKRFGRKRRILPEIADGGAAQGLLKQAGLNRHDDQTGYQSLWWDLNVSDDTAREHLKSNWRGSLHKAEQANLKIEWDDQGRFYPWLRTQYSQDKVARGYNGISPQLLDNIAAISPSARSMIIGKASHEGRNIAGVLMIKHGQSATYQVGWSSDDGRKHCAHHILLWRARQVLKSYGIMDLDLGGFNEDDFAAGLKKFKTGTQAQPYKLVGHYD